MGRAARDEVRRLGRGVSGPMIEGRDDDPIARRVRRCVEKHHRVDAPRNRKDEPLPAAEAAPNIGRNSLDHTGGHFKKVQRRAKFALRLAVLATPGR
jgi:hypothetical protein